MYLRQFWQLWTEWPPEVSGVCQVAEDPHRLSVTFHSPPLCTHWHPVPLSQLFTGKFIADFELASHWQYGYWTIAKLRTLFYQCAGYWQAKANEMSVYYELTVIINDIDGSRLRLNGDSRKQASVHWESSSQLLLRLHIHVLHCSQEDGAGLRARTERDELLVDGCIVIRT